MLYKYWNYKPLNCVDKAWGIRSGLRWYVLLYPSLSVATIPLMGKRRVYSHKPGQYRENRAAALCGKHLDAIEDCPFHGLTAIAQDETTPVDVHCLPVDNNSFRGEALNIRSPVAQEVRNVPTVQIHRQPSPRLRW